MPQPRSFGQKVAFTWAVFSAVCAVICAGALVWSTWKYDFSHVYSASFLAATVFFISCTIVLHVIGQPAKHKLLPWDADETQTS